MFRKKPVYIITIVVATLLLIADLFFYKTTASFTTFSQGSFPAGVSSDTRMPSMGGMSGEDGETASESTGADSSTTFPQAPEQSADGEAPAAMPSGTDGETPAAMPSGTDFSEDMQQMSGKIQGLTAVRKFCIPLAILCILLDLISIIRLVQISKKKQKTESAAPDSQKYMTREEREAFEAQQIVEESIRRRTVAKRRNAVLAIILALLLVGISVASKFARASASGSQVKEETLQAEVTAGAIDTTLSSYGTLAQGDSTDVTIPGTVSIVSYAVSDGDSVKSGDLIATVDKTTVLSSIADLQTLMDELDSELDSISDDKESETVEASVDGRIVAIYASAGTSVVDTMYDHSALMLVSLDGKLAVDFETNEDLSTGDGVTVTDSSGTDYTGHVASSLKGQVTVTVSDDGPAVDDTVTVKDSSGKKLAEGTLYVHSCQKITGFCGTVSQVNVAVGDQVEDGDTLLTLEDTGYTANYNKLIQERETLEEQMQVLMEVYMTGGIYAESDGVISNLTETEEDDSETAGTSSKAAAAGTTSKAAATSKAATGSKEEGRTAEAAVKTASAGFSLSGTTVVMVSAVTGSSDSPAVVSEADDQSSEESSGSEEGSQTGSGSSETEEGSQTGSGSSETEEGSQTGSAASETGDSGNTDNTQSTTTSESQSTDDTVESSDNQGSTGTTDSQNTETTEDSQTTESIPTEVIASWLLSLNAESLNAFLKSLDYTTLKTIYDAYRAYETKSAETSGDGTTDGESGTTAGDSSAGSASGTDAAQSAAASASTLPSGVDISALSGITGSGSTSATAVSGTDISSVIQSMTGSLGSGVDYSGVLSSSAANALMSQTGTAAAGTTESGTDEADTSEKTYAMEETEIAVLTPADTMSIDVTVDELDILNVLVNTGVQVTLDALTGQSFEGTITHIDTDGTNSGGDTKYTVTVTIDRTEDMLDGMNANVSMVLSTKEDCLTIPEAALYEEANHVYVYTGYDEKKDELTGRTEVTCGVSDGTNVEITAGLKKGDTVYYNYAGTILYQFK